MNAAKAIGKKLMEKKWPIAGNAFWGYISYTSARDSGESVKNSLLAATYDTALFATMGGVAYCRSKYNLQHAMLGNEARYLHQ